MLIPSNNKFGPQPSFLLFTKQQVCRITPYIVVFQAPGFTEKQQILRNPSILLFLPLE